MQTDTPNQLETQKARLTWLINEAHSVFSLNPKNPDRDRIDLIGDFIVDTIKEMVPSIGTIKRDWSSTHTDKEVGWTGLLFMIWPSADAGMFLHLTLGESETRSFPGSSGDVNFVMDFVNVIGKLSNGRKPKTQSQVSAIWDEVAIERMGGKYVNIDIWGIVAIWANGSIAIEDMKYLDNQRCSCANQSFIIKSFSENDITSVPMTKDEFLKLVSSSGGLELSINKTQDICETVLGIWPNGDFLVRFDNSATKEKLWALASSENNYATYKTNKLHLYKSFDAALSRVSNAD